ncbi:hypothetical protein PR001_g4367 [Phytophthora rubi]|uniref:Ubiquitin-like protease family profile domain-containing protein n=1 Tax=Phytophthora rubi TaxID=129364 RepID=A0A6A3N9Y6_9STRA|nr:hypothetical protein PR002_g6054 [Phytophthora rubi]KAE9047017.1 hypothetical protein PR001_g4367 [Phytophthora rubi]
MGVALQKKKTCLAERDISVEIPGIGFFMTATLIVMRSYHRATAAARQVEKAMTWIPTVHVSLPVVCHFRAHEDPSMTDKMESLRLLSSEVEVLDLAATGCLSDNTMTTMIAKNFAPDPTRIVGSANLVNVILGNNFAVDHAGVKTLFFSSSAERVMIPVNCNGNHWCSIMIDFAEQKLFYYDPMESTYKLGLRAAAQSIKSIVPGWQSRTARVQPCTSTLGVRTDSYSCGIYVLVTFEVFSGAVSPGIVDKKTLQHLRYRYLSMCM